MGQVGAVANSISDDLGLLAERMPTRMKATTPEEQRLLERDQIQLVAARDDLIARLDAKDPELQSIKSELSSSNVRQQLDRVVIWLRDLISLNQEMSLVQARARVESIFVEPVNIDAQMAFRLACSHRLDIMNNRAALVDTWRLIQFNADALQSDLDIVFNGDIGTVGNNSVKFRGETGRLSAGIRFDAPFTRLLERNNYRQSLIDYQRDRRQLIQFYDSVNLGMRQLLRTMDQLRVNLEIQRRAVVIAIRRVDLTREDLNEPTAPPEPGQPASQLGPTAALNLLTALSDLRNTQNNFMSVWLNYYASQMRLHRDTGLMQLDESGAWIDVPLFETAEVVEDDTIALPPPVPEQWIEQAYQPAEGEDAAPPIPEDLAPTPQDMPLYPTLKSDNV